jgi:peptide/nickel transport system ATP-binding protein
MPDETVLIEAVHATRKFDVGGRGPGRRATLVAVDDVSLSIREHETLAIVGESGCGKTTLGRSLVRLDTLTAGEIRYRGKDVTHLGERRLRPLRSRVRIVFQDHHASLNPRRTIGATVATPLRVHDRPHGRAEVLRILESVGLGSAQIDSYPHQLSGGQRQRAGIARAIAVDPEVVVLDEPVSALDVSIQAQICNLLRDLQDQRGVAYAFISHDLGVVRQVADRVAVMYLGRIVEEGTVAEIYRRPAHPYTEALLSAVPVSEVRADRPRRVRLAGDAPSPLDMPTGCRFQSRCSYATDLCRTSEPALVRDASGRAFACHHPRTEIAVNAAAAPPDVAGDDATDA